MTPPTRDPSPAGDDQALAKRLDPLFYPRGIVVTGVSSHPGKFGTAAFHNLIRFGFEGETFPINREGAEVLGRPTLRSIDEVPDGAADLVFVCTPTSVNAELLRACAAKGVRAAFFAAAGYGDKRAPRLAHRRRAAEKLLSP